VVAAGGSEEEVAKAAAEAKATAMAKEAAEARAAAEAAATATAAADARVFVEAKEAADAELASEAAAVSTASAEAKALVDAKEADDASAALEAATDTTAAAEAKAELEAKEAGDAQVAAQAAAKVTTEAEANAEKKLQESREAVYQTADHTYWSQGHGTGTQMTLSFTISKSTLAFQAGYGMEGTTISLMTKDKADGSFSDMRRQIRPVTDTLQEYFWDVSGMAQEEAVLVIEKLVDDPHVFVNNVRLLNQAPGCIAECLVIEKDDEHADRLRFMGMQYSPVNHGTSFSDETSALYCAHDDTGLKSAGATIGPKFNQFPDGMTDKNLGMAINFPSCIMVRELDDKTFDIAVEHGAQRFSYSNLNVPDGVLSSSLHCVYPTSQPRCIAYHGILVGVRQTDLHCSERAPLPPCTETVLNKFCPIEADILCGDSKKVRDALKCCDQSNNLPGSCMARRRLGASLKTIRFSEDKVTDKDMAEECARACLKQADTTKCLAWRLDDFDNSCKLASKCFVDSAPEVNNLGLKHNRWNLMSADSNPLEGQTVTVLAELI